MSIRLEKVDYIYEPDTAFPVHAIDHVSLTIQEGQFIGLIGHTGSGKSTLIQHLNGLIKPTSGKIYYNGEDIYGEGFSLKKLRSKVGLVFQYPEHQLFEADVFSDVCFGPKNLGLPREEIERRASLSKSAMVQNCGLPDERVFSDLSKERPQDSTGYFATVIVKE